MRESAVGDTCIVGQSELLAVDQIGDGDDDGPNSDDEDGAPDAENGLERSECSQ